MGIRITWTENNLAEDKHRVYRDTAPMDPNSLPVPLVELPADVEEYEDGDGIVQGTTYYYRVSAVATSGVERVSDELVIDTGDPAPPALDFTTFTEVDPAGYIVVNAPSSVSAVDIPRNTDAYLYDDFGAGHFADFVADFTLDCTGFKTSGSGAPIVRTMVFGNSIDDAWNIPNQVCVTLYHYISDLQITPESYDGGTRTLGTTLFTPGAGDVYYARLRRGGATVYLDLATSAANRDAGTWAYQSSVAVPAAAAYRYFYPVASVNVSNSGTCSATVYDVTLTV